MQENHTKWADYYLPTRNVQAIRLFTSQPGLCSTTSFGDFTIGNVWFRPTREIQGIPPRFPSVRRFVKRSLPCTVTENLRGTKKQGRNTAVHTKEPHICWIAPAHINVSAGITKQPAVPNMRRFRMTTGFPFKGTLWNLNLSRHSGRNVSGTIPRNLSGMVLGTQPLFCRKPEHLAYNSMLPVAAFITRHPELARRRKLTFCCA